jgi:thiaminase/transcriptional activator TenA
MSATRQQLNDPRLPPSPTTDDARLTTALWVSIDAVYRQILAHPFLTGLTDGTLDEAAFRFYAVQDAHYLDRFARALGLAAAKAPTTADVAMLTSHARDAIAVERSLHETFFAEFGLTSADIETTPLAPTTLAYTSYFLAVAATGTFAEALGALLPCYWIYWEVGKTLLERGSPNPLYQRWIATYGGDEFAATVRDVLALTNRIGAEIGPAERANVFRHFLASSRYEWMFWDASLKLESWPV